MTASRVGAAFVAFVVIVLTVLAGCSGAGTSSSPSAANPPDAAVGLSQTTTAAREDGPSAQDDMRNKRFPEPLIDPAEILSGGPPPDGIPALDEPRSHRASDVDWLADREAVNDTIRGRPVVVTYCPLCNSRQTAAGTMTGTKLKAIPMGAVAWRDFRDAHPDAWVLSRDTGYDRAYGQNPYQDYDDADSPPLFGQPRDIGTVAVFAPTADGRRLHFRPSGKGFVDRETGSSWNVLGKATSGPLAGDQLEPRQHVDTFWFAWVAFQPDTRVVG